MALNLTATLQKALRQLETEQTKIGQQITALQAVLRGLSPPQTAKPARKAAAATPRRPMSPKARKAARARMQAYWAKKKAEAGKGTA
ncbi:MAG: hypothetical protein WCI75_03265 [candidate division NC10 bacterium]